MYFNRIISIIYILFDFFSSQIQCAKNNKNKSNCPAHITNGTIKCGLHNKYGHGFKAASNCYIGENNEFAANFEMEKYAEVDSNIVTKGKVIVKQYGCVPRGAVLSKNFVVPAFGTVKLTRSPRLVWRPQPASSEFMYKLNLETGECERVERSHYMT